MRRGTQYGLDSDPKADWRQRAACLDADPELFYPVSTSPTAADWAKRVCAGCPVTDRCLAYAMEMREEFGVWGGLTPDERRKTQRQCKRCGATFYVDPKSKRLRCDDCTPDFERRRVEITALAAAGLTDRQIGNRLGISLDSVQWARKRHAIPPGRPAYGGPRGRWAP